MKIKIDKNLCIGCGSCVSVCEDCFELTDDNKACVKQDNQCNCDDECIKQVVDICPVNAIEVENNK
ncbi:MAG: ferredoxin [bacterium]